MRTVFIQHRHGSSRTHINHDQRGLMLPQGSHVRYNQIRTGLSGVFQQNIQTGFQAGAYHQGNFSGQLLDGGAHGVEHLRNNGSNDGAFNVLIADTIDLHQNFQIHTVLVRGLGSFRAKSGLKDDLLIPDTAQDNIRITDING